MDPDIVLSLATGEARCLSRLASSSLSLEWNGQDDRSDSTKVSEAQ